MTGRLCCGILAVFFTLASQYHAVVGFVVPVPTNTKPTFSVQHTGTTPTELYAVRKFVRRIFRRKRPADDAAETDDPAQEETAPVTLEEAESVADATTADDKPNDDDEKESEVATLSTEEEEEEKAEEDSSVKEPSKKPASWVPAILKPKEPERVSVCIVGGGVSGLTAAITCANGIASMDNKKNKDGKVLLLEASNDVGGRVRSDKTEDGYMLDRGFAVFIKEYPTAKKLLDYDALGLGDFLPGALVKLKSQQRLARVADPLRQPEQVFEGLMAPIGDLMDKINILSLALHVKSKTIEQLFDETETSTQDALTKRWMYSSQIVDSFFNPFLQGIYLAPLNQQSSRMFSFVFKMFSDGAAALPEGGIGAVSQQLAYKAKKAGAEIRLDTAVTTLVQDDKGFIVTTEGGERIAADALVIATEGPVANELISQISGFESLETLPPQVQRSVGNLYYGFKGEPPVKDPILILNGIGEERGNEENPVNNVCFPSAVAKGYAPDGHSLCSVTILKDTMEMFKGRDDELDAAVRKQLATWFPTHSDDILNSWDLKGRYWIQNAQPGQYQGPIPANVHGGRSSNTYRNKPLPDGIFVCGDHMSSATLNGALESGVLAGVAASMKVPA